MRNQGQRISATCSSSDLTIRTEAAGVEPVPLWLFLVVMGEFACSSRRSSL